MAFYGFENKSQISCMIIRYQLTSPSPTLSDTFLLVVLHSVTLASFLQQLMPLSAAHASLRVSAFTPLLPEQSSFKLCITPGPSAQRLPPKKNLSYPPRATYPRFNFYVPHYPILFFYGIYCCLKKSFLAPCCLLISRDYTVLVPLTPDTG